MELEEGVSELLQHQLRILHVLLRLPCISKPGGIACLGCYVSSCIPLGLPRLVLSTVLLELSVGRRFVDGNIVSSSPLDKGLSHLPQVAIVLIYPFLGLAVQDVLHASDNREVIHP